MLLLLTKALAIAVIAHAPCPGLARTDWACAVYPATIYLPVGSSVGDRNHELGHVIDYNFLTDQDRGMFKALRGDRRVGWRLPYNSPNEQFAEAVRMCARSAKWPDSTWGYGYAPTTRQHRRICRWLGTLR